MLRGEDETPEGVQRALKDMGFRLSFRQTLASNLRRHVSSLHSLQKGAEQDYILQLQQVHQHFF